MRHYSLIVLALNLVCGSVLTGCAGESGSSTALVSDSQSQLSDGKIAAVNAAARKMVGNGSAGVRGLRANAAANGAGTDVCGYVAMPQNASTPLYVELREKDGVAYAERGQIGDTPQNAAKVRFMCRNHGEW